MDQMQMNYSCTLDTSNKTTRLLGLEIQQPLHLRWAGSSSELLLCPPDATPHLGAIPALQHCSSL